jgi:signal transduction histidine kinase
VRDSGHAIEVLVRDDGAGFDPHRRSTGFGLVGMRERLALVHGTLEIRHPPGRRERPCERRSRCCGTRPRHLTV